MPSVANISFNVRFDLTSAPTLVLTDTSTYPAGAIGIFTVTQPDGYQRTGSFSSPDITSSGGTFSTSLRLSSTGTVQCGTYVIKYEIKTTDTVISTFTRTFTFSYEAVDLSIQKNLDIFTPYLSLVDNTNYQVGTYTAGAVTRSWLVNSTPTGNITSTNQAIDLKYNNNYYDAEYTATLASTLTYQHQTYSWLTILETISKSLTFDVCTPEPLEDIIQLLEQLRQDSINCSGDFPQFEKAQSLYTHLMDMLKVLLVGGVTQEGIYDVYTDLIAILRNGQECAHTNSIIYPYDITNYIQYDFPFEASYSVTIGNNTNNTFTINHNLNDTTVIAQVYKVSTGELIICDISVVDANNVSVSFNDPPSSNEYRVVVLGGIKGVANNIYNSNGTLTANRTVNQSGYDLLFTNGKFYIQTNDQSALFSTKYISGQDGKNIFIGGGGQNLISTAYAYDGSYSTAIGIDALSALTTGGVNTAVGYRALYSDTTGGANTAVGSNALYSATTGFSNTAVGSYALNSSNGTYNTAVGAESLSGNSSGNYNTALGFWAGKYNSFAALNTTSSNGVYIGANTKTATGSGITNEIVIGYNAIGAGSNSVTLGNTSITKTILRGNVLINTTSDTGNYKADINGAVRISGNLTTNITSSILKTDAGGVLSSAIASTDYVIPSDLSVLVPKSRSLTINGTAYDLSADRSFSVGTVTSVGLSMPTGFTVSPASITSSGTFSVSYSSGYSVPTTIKQSNWDDAYTWVAAFPTQTGNSGKFLTTNGSSLSWATVIAGVQSVSATSPLSSTGGSTPTISIQVANGSQSGYLSSTDWNTFNNKQAAGNYITALTGEVTASGPGSVSATISNSAVIGKVLTGLSVTGSSISAADTILTAFGKIQNQINTMVGGVIYQGTWNASTNTPTITSSTGTKGNYYVVSVAGSTTIDGVNDWKIGDWIIFNGSTWDKVDNTDSVSSVNGFTGAVSLTTTNISEGTNLYYTDSRARGAISLTTTGSSGAATYSNTTGVLNIPTYTLSGLGGVPTTRSLTINGTALDLSADRTFSVGTVTSVAALTIGTTGTDITSSVATGTTTPVITLNIPTASAANRGALSSADWTTFNNKQAAISLTTTGSSGAATFTTNTLNIPNYTLSGLGGVPTTRSITINGTAQDLSADRTFSVGTVTSVAALTIGTTGTDVTSTVATGTTTPVITLNIPDASASARGLITTGTQTIAGDKTFNGTTTIGGAITYLSSTELVYYSNSGAQLANQTILGTAGVLVLHKARFNVSGQGLNANAAGIVFYEVNRGTAYTTASSGTHPLVAYKFMKGLVVNANATTPASVTNYATLYIEDAATGTATITNNYAIWVDNGAVRFDGNVELQGISSATTSNVVYYDTTTKRLSYGTITAGSTTLAALTDVSITSVSNGQLLRYNSTSSKWENWTPNYITANQSITWTASGDVSGSASGTTSISPSLTNTGLRGVALPTLGASAGLLKYTGTGTNTWVFDTSTYLTANQSITLSGDVTGTGSTAITTSISNAAVTYAKIQNVAANTFLANATGSAASVQEISTTRIPLFASAITGSPSATTYLRGDGSWATVTGGSATPGGADTNIQYNSAGAFAGSATFTFTPTSALLVNNSVTAAAAIARGINFTPTLTAAANNDVLVGLDINPTFTLGAFTGTSSAALVVRNGNVGIGTASLSYPLTRNGMTLKASGTDGVEFLMSSSTDTGQTGTAFVRTGVDFGITNRSNGLINFGTNNTTWLYLTAAATMGIGTSTIGSKLQVNGNAAIGYSASTAAPTNGLFIAGNTGIGTNSIRSWSASYKALEVGNGFGIMANASNYDSYFVSNAFYNGTSWIVSNSASANPVQIAFNSAIYFSTGSINTIGSASTMTIRMVVLPSGNVVIGNDDTAASPNTGIIRGTNGSGTNIAGAEFRIQGGIGTGTGAGGAVTIYTANAGTTGSALNTATEKFRVAQTGQIKFNSYTSTSSFTGTTVGYLAFDSAGNIITVAPSTGAGTVTDVSVVSANGFAGTVATSTSTPAITLSTTVTGILKGNGTAISAAVAGTDYVIPSALSSYLLSSTAASNYVPYNGASNNLDLGIYALIASQVLPNYNDTTPGSSGDVDALYTNTKFSGGGGSSLKTNWRNITSRFTINVSSGTLTNYYSFYATAPITTSGTITNKYAFYSEAGAGPAVFGSTVTATSLIKSGGTASQILAADGTVITAGSGVTISGGTISASGSSAYTVTSQTTTYTATATSGTLIIKCDTTGGAFTVNLPTAVGNTATIIIKKTAGSGAVTVDGSGTETVDGGLTATINKVYESITLISDNANWQIV